MLTDCEFSLGGVTFGGKTVYAISSVSGFGLGGKREKVFQVPGADGVEWGREYRNGPTITFEGVIECHRDPAAAYAAMLTLRAAFDGKGTGSRVTPRTTKLLGLKWPGQAEMTIAGRPDRFDPVIADDFALGLIPFSATFIAAAPLAV
jgi:hypothetical protein